MKNFINYKRKELRFMRNDHFVPEKEKYLKNLRFIYCAENYCLRRIPKLVTLIRHEDLSSLLSDHVSVLMDRLNRLDDTFARYGKRPGGLSCSTFKALINNLGKLVTIIQSANTLRNIELLDELLAISNYRKSVYEHLATVTTENEEEDILVMFNECLQEEDIFSQNLTNIRMHVSKTNCLVIGHNIL